MPRPWDNAARRRQARCLVDSHRHWTSRDLVAATADDQELAAALFTAPFVLVAHGTEADPRLSYGNATALALWEMTWEEFIGTPSRLTAEAPDREARARLLAEVTRNGFIADYAGVRISRTGRRFRIAEATVWNLVGADGLPAGQAAWFRRWEFL